MSRITTHVLDISNGAPARGVRIDLEQHSPGGWTPFAAAQTDADGRVLWPAWQGIALLEAGTRVPDGVYRLRFETGAYFEDSKIETLYPFIEVVFTVAPAASHYHIPLLLSPFGYSTYRGT